MASAVNAKQNYDKDKQNSFVNIIFFFFAIFFRLFSEKRYREAEAGENQYNGEHIASN
jgi:hypothetical protein